MKKILLLLFVNVLTSAQTITFQGCANLFDNNSFVFNKLSTDVNGRNVYQTTPIDGAQICSGLGICEFQISWNATQNRWEFIADDGSGDFSNPYLIYYNDAASLPNPPSHTLGTWQENTTITTGTCGGNLTSSNSTLSGAVQNGTLGTEAFSKSQVLVLSNPVKNELNLLSPYAENASLFDAEGRLVKSISIKKGQNSLDVSALKPGVYFLKTLMETLKIIKN